ncbi:unnamed protein product [Calicophoron daubneyi]
MSFSHSRYKWTADKPSEPYCQNKFKYVKKIAPQHAARQNSPKVHSLDFKNVPSGSCPSKSSYSVRSNISLPTDRTAIKSSASKYKYFKNISNVLHASETAQSNVKTVSTAPSVTSHAIITNAVAHVSDCTLVDSRNKVTTNNTNSVRLSAYRTPYKYIEWRTNAKRGSHALSLSRFSKNKLNSPQRQPKLRQQGGPSNRYKYVRGTGLGAGAGQIQRKKIIRRHSVQGVQVPSCSTADKQCRQNLQRTINRLKYKRRPMCLFFIRTGKCKTGPACHYVHDPNYIRICPRYLNQCCPLGDSSCPLAHVLDPCRIPQCEFYDSTGCTRDHCPYLHISHQRSTPVCKDFVHGRCPRGRSCSKRHVWAKAANFHRKYSVTSTNSAKQKQSNHAQAEVKTPFIASGDPVEPPPVADKMALPPLGSLRDVYPAPEFIPLMDGEEDSIP